MEIVTEPKQEEQMHRKEQRPKSVAKTIVVCQELRETCSYGGENMQKECSGFT